MATARNSIESILLDRSWVSAQDLDKARKRKKPGQELADVLVEMKVLDTQRLARALAQEYRLPFQAHIDENTVDISPWSAKVPINFAKKNRLLPLAGVNGTVTVAIADPANYEPLDDLCLLFGAQINSTVVPSQVIAEAINRAYDQASATTAEDLKNIGLEDVALDAVANQLAQEPQDLLESDDSAPIIKLVNGVLSQAVKDRASDIHIEVFETEMVIRFRVDGMLYDVLSPGKRFQPAITSRVKVMSGLNIAEKRLPQDGRIRLRIAGRDIDIRVSCIPTAFGERLVLRLLDRAQAAVDIDLDHLGFSGENLARAGPADPAEPRDHPGDRTDRFGQIDHAVRLSVPDQFAGKEHHHDRGPDRIPIARRRPDAGESEDRADLRQRTAIDSAPGSRRNHGRRNPRFRDRRNRDSVRPDRPSGLLDHPYQRLLWGGIAAGRNGNRTVSGLVLDSGRGSAAIDPQAVPRLPRTLPAVRRGTGANRA